MNIGPKTSGWSLKSNEFWKININQKFEPFRYFLECIHCYLVNFVYFVKLEFKRDALNFSEVFEELKKQLLNLSGSCFISYIGSIGIILDHRIKVAKSWWRLGSCKNWSFVTLLSQFSSNWCLQLQNDCDFLSQKKLGNFFDTISIFCDIEFWSSFASIYGPILGSFY